MKVNTKFFAKIILIFVFLISALFCLNAYADGQGIWADTECARGSERGGPIRSCDLCDAFIVAKNILDILIKFAFIIGGIMILVGGATMLVSAGKPDLIKKGRNTIIKAGIGIAIVLTSYLIVGTIIHILSGRADFPWNKISCERKDYVATGGRYDISGLLYFKIANDGIIACGKSKEELEKIHPKNGEIYQFYKGVSRIAIEEYRDEYEEDKIYKEYCGLNLVRKLNEEAKEKRRKKINKASIELASIYFGRKFYYFYYEKRKVTDTSTIYYYSTDSCNFGDTSVQEDNCNVIYYIKCFNLGYQNAVCPEKVVKQKEPK